MSRHTLRQNVVCIDAARCLYYLWGRYYQEPVIDFDKLSPAAKHIWVERAKETFEVAGPRRRTAQAEFDSGFNETRLREVRR